MLRHFLTPECQKNYTIIRRMCIKSGSLIPVCSGLLRTQTSSTEKHFKQDRCTFVKILLFFLFIFTSYTLVCVALKKNSTLTFYSTKFPFQKCIKCIIIQNPVISADMPEPIGNQSTELWVRGTHKTRSKTCYLPL